MLRKRVAKAHHSFQHLHSCVGPRVFHYRICCIFNDTRYTTSSLPGMPRELHMQMKEGIKEVNIMAGRDQCKLSMKNPTHLTLPAPSSNSQLASQLSGTDSFGMNVKESMFTLPGSQRLLNTATKIPKLIFRELPPLA